MSLIKKFPIWKSIGSIYVIFTGGLLGLYAGKNEKRNIEKDQYFRYVSLAEQYKRIAKNSLLGAMFGPLAIPTGLLTMSVVGIVQSQQKSK